MTEQKIEVHFLEQEIGIQIYALSKVVFSEVKHNKEKYMAITKHAVSIHQQGGSKELPDGIKTTDEDAMNIVNYDEVQHNQLQRMGSTSCSKLKGAIRQTVQLA